MLHQLFSLMCVWCVIKVGGGGGGAPTSLDVNGLKRVACGFKEAGIATKKKWTSSLYHMLPLSCGFSQKTAKWVFLVTPVLPYHLPQRRRRVHENACFIPTVL